MGVWRDIKARLGLGDDYDDYDDYEEDADEGDDSEPAPAYRSPYEDEPTTIRRVNRKPDLERARETARQMPAVGEMQAVPPMKMQIVEPRAFAEAQSIADKFKMGMPVIMNLTMTEPELSRRLIDFASGLTYGLNGGLQKVSDRVFMLTPANVDVSAAQRAVMRDKGLFGIDE